MSRNELQRLNEDLCGGRLVKQGTADTHKSIHFKGFACLRIATKTTASENDGKIGGFECMERQNICGKVAKRRTEKKQRHTKFICELSTLLKMCRKTGGTINSNNKKTELNEKHSTVH